MHENVLLRSTLLRSSKQPDRFQTTIRNFSGIQAPAEDRPEFPVHGRLVDARRRTGLCTYAHQSLTASRMASSAIAAYGKQKLCPPGSIWSRV